MKNKEEWYIINDLEDFVETTRTVVYDLFGNNSPLYNTKKISDLKESELEELNNVLTQKESLSIAKTMIKEQYNKITQKVRYIISDKSFNLLIESLNRRMISNMLHGLAKRDLLEIAYDSEINDFIFWPKDNDENNSQTPKTN
jgi:deoxyhypusine synthase